MRSGAARICVHYTRGIRLVYEKIVPKGANLAQKGKLESLRSPKPKSLGTHRIAALTG
jgi:hypothetical protein